MASQLAMPLRNYLLRHQQCVVTLGRPFLQEGHQCYSNPSLSPRSISLLGTRNPLGRVLPSPKPSNNHDFHLGPLN
jgi:hypothetical protein